MKQSFTEQRRLVNFRVFVLPMPTMHITINGIHCNMSTSETCMHLIS